MKNTTFMRTILPCIFLLAITMVFISCFENPKDNPNDNNIISLPDYFVVVGTLDNGSDTDICMKIYSPDGTEYKTDTYLYANDETPYGVSVDELNNIYVVGTSGQNWGPNPRDWLILKYNTDGNIIWDIIIDLPDDNEKAIAYDVANDSKNNIFVVGSVGNPADLIIKKYFPNGEEDENWNIRLDGGLTGGYAKTVFIDSSDNVYVVGKFADGYPGSSWWLLKYDSNSTELYNEKLSIVDYSFARTVGVNPQDGQIYIGGSEVNGTSSHDWLLRKYSIDISTGELIENTSNLWGDYLQNDESGVLEYPNDIAFDSSGYIYFAGKGEGGWLINKMRMNGEKADSVSFDPGNQSDDMINAIDIDSSNRIYAVGYENNDGDKNWIIKRYDSNLEVDSNFSEITVGSTEWADYAYDIDLLN